MLVEVCYLIDAHEGILWFDVSTSPEALPDSSQRWQAIWTHRAAISVVAHTHPGGLLAFSAEDRTTMAAIDAALGRPLRYAVVTGGGLIYREADGRARVETTQPGWVPALRAASGMEEDRWQY